MIDRRSKMVSFRLSWDEYQAYREACDSAGVRSLSELARAAMQHLIAERPNGASLDDQVRELRRQVSQLSREVEHIARRVDQQK
jgi:translation initiation factor 2B subunit (eIF-2B alpha/beta/delta family)